MPTELEHIPNPIDVFLLPEHAAKVDLSRRVVVLIDVLRATTTMVTALSNGALSIAPCREIEEAKALAAEQPGTLLGGEREGKKIDGFDLGNSPAEYSRDVIGGCQIVMTTTNGTAALHQVQSADKILIGAFSNAGAVANALSAQSGITIVCAGTDGFVTGEDTMAAGAIVERLQETDQSQKLNDQAQLALTAWRAVGGRDHKTGDLVDAMLRTHGGLNLAQIGMEADIEFCAVVDRFDAVPELDTESWQVRMPH